MIFYRSLSPKNETYGKSSFFALLLGMFLKSYNIIYTLIFKGGVGLTLYNCSGSNNRQQDKFFKAIKNGNVWEVENLLKSGGVDVNGRLVDHYSFLG